MRHKKAILRRGTWALLVAVFGMVLADTASAAMVMRRGNMAEPDTLDPHLSGSSWEFNIIGELFMGLTTEDPHADPIPGMAETWTVSPDGMVWTFKLREGVTWSDGVPLKASDFVFGFQRLLDPKTAAKYASIQYVIKNAEKINAGEMPVTELGVRAPDDRTVEITLDQPAPFLPGLLRHVTAYPIPEHAVKKFGEDWVKPGNMVSNGPYIVKEWESQDHITVVKNPKFYDAENVRIDEVIFYPITDDNAALARYRAGQLDANIGTAGFNINQYAWLQENMPGQAFINPALSNEYISMNIRRPPFSDARVRRAVSLCIDRGVLAEKVMRDKSIPAYSFIPPTIGNYKPVARLDFANSAIEKRRAEARTLLAEAGYTSGNPLTFQYNYVNSRGGRRSTIGVAAMLKQCGIIMRPLANEARVHYVTIQQRDFTAAWASWGADFNDPQNFLFLLDPRSGVWNYGGYDNEEFKRLVDEAKVTLDLEKRAGLMAQAEQIALDDSAVAPLSFRTFRDLVAPYVKGYSPNPDAQYRSRWMWLDKKE